MLAGRRMEYLEPTFFCNRTTLVHFFSSRPSYFLTVLESRTSSGRLSSCRSAAAVSGRLFADRYAMIDLWLPAPVSPCRSCNSAYGIGGVGLAAHQLDGESISGSLCICARPGCPLRRETGYVLIGDGWSACVV